MKKYTHYFLAASLILVFIIEFAYISTPESEPKPTKRDQESLMSQRENQKLSAKYFLREHEELTLPLKDMLSGNVSSRSAQLDNTQKREELREHILAILADKGMTEEARSEYSIYAVVTTHNDSDSFMYSIAFIDGASEKK